MCLFPLDQFERVQGEWVQFEFILRHELSLSLTNSLSHQFERVQGEWVQFEFIFEDYQTQYYYWELVEIVRKQVSALNPPPPYA